MRRKIQTIVVAIGGLLLPAIASAASVSDDFNDNTIGSQWTYVSQVPNPPNQLNLVEQNQRLEAISGGPTASHTDALYLSNFQLSTASNFDMTIDFSFKHYQSAGSLLSTFGVDFGVGTDPAGTNAAAMAFGYLNAGTSIQPVTSVGYRTAPSTSDTLVPVSTANLSNGTFTISYDSASDALTFESQQAASTPVSYTLTGVVHGAWNASNLLVSFGARGNGFTTASGDAYLDNFTLVSGTVTPEPACLTGIVIASSALLGRRRRLT